MFQGRFSWISEAFGGVLLFLLPLKFAGLVSLPAITMIYWNDLISILIAAWAFPIFPVCAGLFLVTSLLFVPGELFPGRAGKFAGLWLLLGIASFAGGIAKGTPPDAFDYYMDHALSLGAFLFAFVRAAAHNKKLPGIYHGLFSAAFLISLLIGLNQYFSGYQTTIDKITSENMSGVNASILFRLKEMRITGGFSACNAFAGYLVLGLPVVLAWLWRMGNRVSPPHVSRILFTVPVFLVSVFLLVKTGSRGGILSLFAGLFIFFYAAALPKKWRIALFSLIPIGIAGIAALVLLGRGGKSILFRLDYFQGAFRMMLDSPFTGTGWGGFQREFMLIKYFVDREAPASPHNFPLSLGSQTGVIGFLIACLILFAGFFCLFRYLSRTTLKENVSDERIMLTGSLAGLTAFSVHSLQDVLFETPGAILSYGAVVILALILIEPEKERTAEPVKWLRYVMFFLLAGYAGLSLWFGVRVLSFDHSLAALNDMTDYRMIKPEQYSLIDPAEVRRAFDHVHRKNPGSPFPLLTISDFYAMRGELETALEWTLSALKLDPESAAYHMRAARMYYRLNRMEEAESYRKQAEKLFPKNPQYKTLEQQ